MHQTIDLPTIGVHLLADATSGADSLPPTTKAAAMMAILGILLLGMLLIVIVLLGGNWVRRQGNLRRGPTVPPDRTPLPPRKAGNPVLTEPASPHESRETLNDASPDARETRPS